jgi:8-oxo-dGTP pyrophosphatase MutT (NUDIX family)
MAVGQDGLRAEPDLARAREILAAYPAPDAEQEATRRRMLAFIEAHPEDAHLRTCLEGHLTASSLILDADGERALLGFHKKLGRWLQLGGHCDGDANLAHVALREAQEESGIEALEIDSTPVDLDIHTIPARPGEPEHLHLDTRYLLRAAPGSVPVVSEESLELCWVTPEEARSMELDDSLRRLFAIAFG